MPEVDGRVRELVDQVQTAVAHAVVTCLASAGTTNPLGRSGSTGLTIPSSPCLHEAIVQAINAITAGLRVLLRACHSTTLPFRSLITPEVAPTPRSSRAPPDRTSWRSAGLMSQAQGRHA